jgi:hypothetical protein
MKNILIVFGVVLLAWFGLSFFDMSNEKKAEEEFNNSGRAKAIENESDLWPFYENAETGLFLNYPMNLVLKKADEKYQNNELSLTVAVDEIDTIEDLMGYDKESSLLNMAALAKGEYGNEADFALESSQKVRNLGEVNAQEFMVLGRFEICDVTFERKLMFFKDNQRIIATVRGNKDLIASTMPEYFEKNVENCGEELIWNLDKMEDFYKVLSEGNGSDEAQEWFDSFEDVANTIKFVEKVDTEISTKDLLLGKWTSIDDDKSVIEFTETEKTDYYDGEKMGQDKFQIYFSKADLIKDDNGSHLVVMTYDGDMEYTVVHVGANDLELTYLPRGNTLKYTR